jgi:hypothetical protein
MLTVSLDCPMLAQDTKRRQTKQTNKHNYTENCGPIKTGQNWSNDYETVPMVWYFFYFFLFVYENVKISDGR